MTTNLPKTIDFITFFHATWYLYETIMVHITYSVTLHFFMLSNSSLLFTFDDVCYAHPLAPINDEKQSPHSKIH